MSHIHWTRARAWFTDEPTINRDGLCCGHVRIRRKSNAKTRPQLEYAPGFDVEAARARVRQELTGRIGGPPKREPKEGERVALSLRMTPALKRKLDSSAEAGGRSQSQEAEFSLERSFDRTDLLSEVMTLAYGKELAGVVMMIGEVMAFAGPETFRKWQSITHMGPGSLLLRSGRICRFQVLGRCDRMVNAAWPVRHSEGLSGGQPSRQ